MGKMHGDELAKHASRESCWIALHGEVFDVTEFLDSHPGGAAIILQYGGHDATEAYDTFHHPELAKETLPAAAHLGPIDQPTIHALPPKPSTKPPVSAPNAAPPLSAIMNVDDFALVAEAHLAPNAWAYYSSGADDELSKARNATDFQRIALRPRILRNVESIDTRTRILGRPVSLPVYVSPAALAKLAHPDGECAITSGVGKEGLLQVVSTGASMPIEKIMEARVDKEQPVFFQLYVYKDVEYSKALIRRVEKAGVTAIWLTVDSPVLGKREKDDRIKAQINVDHPAGTATSGQQVQGIARTTASLITPRLEWTDLAWIRETTRLPLVIKGIHTVEDAVLAYNAGVQGIVLSNHGGRSQDTAQGPLTTLLEIRRYAPHLIGSKMEIFLDGGVRRGTDVLKALALGATAVGLGRPFLYSLCGGYGEAGVRRLVQIMRDEVATNMALAGARSVKEIRREMVNPTALEREVLPGVKL